MYFLFPSRYLMHWLIAAHGVVALSLISMPIVFVVKGCLAALSALSFIYSWRHTAVLGMHSFAQESPESWQLHTRQGETINAALLKKNYISDFLIIMHFKSLTATDTFTLLIWPDSLSPQNWHRLQRTLRLQ